MAKALFSRKSILWATFFKIKYFFANHEFKNQINGTVGRIQNVGMVKTKIAYYVNDYFTTLLYIYFTLENKDLFLKV